MIADSIDNAHRYAPIHPGFAQALEYLGSLTTLPAERVTLDGDNLFVLFSHGKGKKKPDAFLEAHKKYIDIHFCVEGREEIGWRQLHRCSQPDTPYDTAKDFMTFKDEPDSWTLLTPGSFAIYFPEDAHAPMVSDGIVGKAVVKVAV